MSYSTDYEPVPVMTPEEMKWSANQMYGKTAQHILHNAECAARCQMEELERERDNWRSATYALGILMALFAAGVALNHLGAVGC